MCLDSPLKHEKKNPLLKKQSTHIDYLHKAQRQTYCVQGHIFRWKKMQQELLFKQQLQKPSNCSVRGVRIVF